MSGLNRYLASLERLEGVPPAGEPPRNAPRFMRQLRIIPYAEFKRRVESYDEEFTDWMFAGDAVIIRGVVNPDTIRRLRHDLHHWGLTTPSSFHKVLDGVPNFHRIVDEDMAKNYSTKAPRHNFYFFRHNPDPFGIWPMINEFLGLCKMFGGFPRDAFVQNRPSDGLVDRISSAHYPSGTGRIERHLDPWNNQRTIMSIQMTKLGVDFQSGGLYFVTQDDREVHIDPLVEPGDGVIAYPTVTHEVKIIDGHVDHPDWTDIRGRWFLGLYTMEPNYVADAVRPTSRPASRHPSEELR